MEKFFPPAVCRKNGSKPDSVSVNEVHLCVRAWDKNTTLIAEHKSQHAILNSKHQKTSAIVVKQWALPKGFCSHQDNYITALLKNKVDKMIRCGNGLNLPNCLGVTVGVAIFSVRILPLCHWTRGLLSTNKLSPIRI
jgi:hypothetical protein